MITNFVPATNSTTKKHMEKNKDIFSLNVSEKLRELTAAGQIASTMFLPLKSSTIGSNITMNKPATYVTIDFQLDSTRG